MSLPSRAPLSRWAFLQFELKVGIPVAAQTLRKHLGLKRTITVLLRTLLCMATTRPLRALPPGRLPPAKEWMTRRQLAQAVLLSDSLIAAGIPTEQVLSITQDVVATVGAKFVGANADFNPNDWSAATPEERLAFAKEAMSRFPNVTGADVVATETSMDVTFSYCRLAEGARAIGRPELSRMFCSADAAYYNGTPSRPLLTRPETIAEGGQACHFQFRWKDETGEMPPRKQADRV